MIHAKAPHGNWSTVTPFGPVITKLGELTAVETRRIDVDKGYRGFNHPQKVRVWIGGA